jgi:hypothetical protein
LLPHSLLVGSSSAAASSAAASPPPSVKKRRSGVGFGVLSLALLCPVVFLQVVGCCLTLC